MGVVPLAAAVLRVRMPGVRCARAPAGRDTARCVRMYSLLTEFKELYDDRCSSTKVVLK